MQDFFDRQLGEVPLVVLDTETTGLNPNIGHRIVEIGAIRLEPADRRRQVTAEFNHLIQPGRPMDPAASRINGIRDEDLVNAPTFGDIADSFLAFIQDALIVAHNARFDAEFLGLELYLHYEFEAGQDQRLLPNPWICTMLLARNNFYFGRNSLSHVAHALGIRVSRAHRALNDVYTTAEVLQRLARELSRSGIITLNDFMTAQGGALYAPTPPKIQLPAPIRRALMNHVPIHIQYQSAYGLTNRLITPLYPTSGQGTDYLIAYCHLRQAQRTFRLDRIIRIEVWEGDEPDRRQLRSKKP